MNECITRSLIRSDSFSLLVAEGGGHYTVELLLIIDTQLTGKLFC